MGECFVPRPPARCPHLRRESARGLPIWVWSVSVRLLVPMVLPWLTDRPFPFHLFLTLKSRPSPDKRSGVTRPLRRGSTTRRCSHLTRHPRVPTRECY
jgi:hypothetical protein